MKKAFALLLATLLAGSLTTAAWADEGLDTTGFDAEYYSRFQGQNMELNVYNWGEYIADGSEGTMDVNKEFEKLTGIKVNYSNFDTNESLYAKLRSGANNYDIIIPSDFMVSRMIDEQLIQPINRENIPNLQYMDPQFMSADYDPTGEYSVPYTWGIVGIIYNSDMVTQTVDSWDILWDAAYSGKILMFSNPSDAFGISLLRLGYNINSQDPDHRREAASELKTQKPLIQAYVMDQIFDKMQGNEAALAPYYVGDFFTMKEHNDALEFAIPKEGTNAFVDAICIPTSSRNKEAAEMYINFLNEPEVAAANIEYIGYSTPNLAAKELLPDEIQNDPLHYPTAEVMANTQSFVNLSNETNQLTNELWISIFNMESSTSTWIVPALIIAGLVVVALSNIHKKKKRKQVDC